MYIYENQGGKISMTIKIKGDRLRRVIRHSKTVYELQLFDNNYSQREYFIALVNMGGNVFISKPETRQSELLYQDLLKPINMEELLQLVIQVYNLKPDKQIKYMDTE